MGKRYYWLKLPCDFFNSKRIKKLRSFEKGDTYLAIYMQLQLLALKTEGKLWYMGLEDDFAQEVALDLNENEEDVRFTLDYLIRYQLLETKDNVEFFLPYVVENTGSETAAAQRMRDSRERKKVAIV